MSRLSSVETCAGSVLGSFHRGSILFLIKWHSVAGGLAGTQLPGKPKNAGLHLVTNSSCLSRLLLHSAPQYYCCRGLCMCVCVCHYWMGPRLKESGMAAPHIACLLLMFAYNILSFLSGSPSRPATWKHAELLLLIPCLSGPSLSPSLDVNGGNRAAIKMHIYKCLPLLPLPTPYTLIRHTY